MKTHTDRRIEELEAERDALRTALAMVKAIIDVALEEPSDTQLATLRELLP